MQIFKNSGAQEVIVSRVQIELHRSVSRLRHIWLNLA
jgi:predicted regulator of amino acid metabolism with ACT domain